MAEGNLSITAIKDRRNIKTITSLQKCSRAGMTYAGRIGTGEMASA